LARSSVMGTPPAEDTPDSVQPAPAAGGKGPIEE
jgi:hypothetical protein